MFVNFSTVKTNLVAKTCALNALPICLFMESIPLTSQLMMRKQCRMQCKSPATRRGRSNAGVWEKSNNKAPEYKVDKNGCMHDNPNQYEEEEYLHHFLEESNRAARDRKREKNMSLVYMDCNKHHPHGCLTGIPLLAHICANFFRDLLCYNNTPAITTAYGAVV